MDLLCHELLESSSHSQHYKAMLAGMAVVYSGSSLTSLLSVGGFWCQVSDACSRCMQALYF
jgi:hypothetical protein